MTKELKVVFRAETILRPENLAKVLYITNTPVTKEDLKNLKN